MSPSNSGNKFDIKCFYCGKIGDLAKFFLRKRKMRLEINRESTQSSFLMKVIVMSFDYSSLIMLFQLLRRMKLKYGSWIQACHRTSQVIGIGSKILKKLLVELTYI